MLVAKFFRDINHPFIAIINWKSALYSCPLKTTGLLLDMRTNSPHCNCILESSKRLNNLFRVSRSNFSGLKSY